MASRAARLARPPAPSAWAAFPRPAPFWYNGCMKIGLSTSCVKVPSAALVDDAARAGIDCFEISLPGRDYASFDYAAFAACAHDAGVDIRSFHLPFYTDETVDPASLDPAIRRRTAELQKRYIGVAASMGASLAIVHAGQEPVEDAERAECLARSKESMAALAEAAASEGLVLCVEDLPRSCLGNTAEELAEIVSVDPRIRVCFDVNHLMKGSHAQFLSVIGPKVAATHISDYDFINERHWLPGEGKIDWRGLIDGLEAVGYEGAFNYEIPFAADPKTVARTRDLVCAEVVRNAREIFSRSELTVIGGGGLPDLPLWP